MVLAARLAQRLGCLEAPLAGRIVSLLEAFGLPVAVPDFDAQQVLDAMTRDKKAERGQFRFVLPTRLGRAEVSSIIASEDVRSVLRS